MSIALDGPRRPCAPVNGLYFRMEETSIHLPVNGLCFRIKNRLLLRILGDTAVLEYPCVEKKKSYTMRLTQFNDYSMVDWTPVDDTWGHERLEFGEMEGVTRLIDNSGKFWTFGEEYSDADVERRRRVVLGHTAPALTNDFVAAAPTCASTDSSRSLRARGTRCK